MAFDFVIIYNLGSSNKVANALSRRSHELAECTLYSSSSINWPVLRQEVDKDSTLARIKQAIRKGKDIPVGFSMFHDDLFYKGQLSLQNPRLSFASYYMSTTIHLLGIMLAKLKHIKDSPQNGTGRVCAGRSPNTFNNAVLANNKKLRINHLLASYSHYLLQLVYGSIFPWILSRVF